MSIDAHRLMAWLSPAFPTGAFAYSHGLEAAIHDGQITGGEDLTRWLDTILRCGALRNDALLLAASHRGEDVADLAAALAGSRERHEETIAQGGAFARTASALLDKPVRAAPLPCAVGDAARQAGIALDQLLPLFLHAGIANLVSVGIRLIPIGQTEGQRVLQALFGAMDAVAAEAMEADIAALGTSALISDIAAMRHETMTTRIFRT